ncbi:MAG: glycosyltransferase family 2 protein [Gallionellaceae bacterium]
MVDPTKVTALLPAYQAAAFIQPTLDSLSQQTHANFDVIISVDVCDDDTHAICVKHAERDSRFRVIQQEQRQGYVGNCNFLLDQADSEYVLFAFHDDILAPGYVEKLSMVLDNRPEVINSYSDVLLTTVAGEREHWIYTGVEGIRDRVQRGMKMLAGVSLWWVPNRGVFRLWEARRIKGLKTHDAGEFSADFPWLFHMSLLGEFARVPETLCFKYYKPGSLSRSWAFTGRQQYEVKAACMREIWISDLTTQEKLKLAAPLITWLIKTYPQVSDEIIPDDRKDTAR